MPGSRPALLAIIQDDVVRLDRLISDISDASRVDAELSRTATEPVDVVPIMQTLGEIADATRGDGRAASGGGRAGRSAGGAGGGRAAGAGAAQPDRQCAQFFARRRDDHAARDARPAAWWKLPSRMRGPAFPDGNLEHVFDRFYSERPPGETFGKHSGLGLSISRQIVEALRRPDQGRRTGATSAGNMLGARFVVRLPKA